MDSQKQAIVDRLKQANNILVTVSADPTVDQLAACLGLTLMLNELGKHAAAVFSGAVPSTIEFLQPEKTLEKNTDSLRDFIISLDKSKADKLRYKVEDKVVKIFITPYKTSISEKDFEFSQGDFNVEVVLALGVHAQKDLDQAITAHGRILHDATVACMNTTAGEGLGTLNWQDPKASSLSEMVATLANSFDKKVLDNQVATALLTGIVSETDRFGNTRTTPETMKASAQLLAAGANQQLVATKLEQPPEPPKAPPEPAPSQPTPQPPEPPKSGDGTLRIDHEQGAKENDKPAEVKLPEPAAPPEPFGYKPAIEQEKERGERPQIHIDEHGQLHHPEQVRPAPREFLSGTGPADVPDVLPTAEDEDRPSGAPNTDPGFVSELPVAGQTLTANSHPESLNFPADPLSATPLTHDTASRRPADTTSSLDGGSPPQTQSTLTPVGLPLPPVQPSTTMAIPDITLPEPTSLPSDPRVSEGSVAAKFPAGTDTKQTLSDLEMSLGSPHVHSARSAVDDAFHSADDQGGLSPIAALNAQPLGDPLHAIDATAGSNVPATPAVPQPATQLVEPLAAKDTHEPAPAAMSPSDTPLDMPLPPTLTPTPANSTPPTSSGTNPSAPPPVPPPMMPLITPLDDK